MNLIWISHKAVLLMNDTNEFIVASKPIDSISSTFWKLCGQSPEALPLGDLTSPESKWTSAPFTTTGV